MEKDKVFEEVKRVNTKAWKASVDVLKKLHLKKSVLDSFTESEKETEEKIFQLVASLDCLSYAYKYVCNDKVSEIRIAVENAISVTCKEIEKLIEN